MLGTETLIVRFLYLWYFIHQNKSLMSVVVRGSLRRSLSRRRKTSLAKTLDLKKKVDPVQQFFFGSECFLRFFSFRRKCIQTRRQTIDDFIDDLLNVDFFLFSHLLMITNIVIYSYSYQTRYLILKTTPFQPTHVINLMNCTLVYYLKKNLPRVS